ncbi:MAG: bifunctional adenosylcobinamide kinase/adenosylcobinamide-phosphate guanylyltransferase, partial [Dehalococcoidia bacterium]|nr:bifunctional adenosylcobinamide kinase/adenosylcobinamide-phosphate guanylyltransferase [Dehalococcoidia bacterium]
MSKRFVVVLGGARSGKSCFAQQIAERISQNVLFVATAEALDEEMRARIAEHRKMRPTTWRTLEAPRNVGQLVEERLGDAEVVLVDCLTLLVSN